MIFLLASSFAIISTMFHRSMPLPHLATILTISSLLTTLYLLYTKTISVLLGLILLIIYLGATMIMIGYVCAISPNNQQSKSIGLISSSAYRVSVLILISLFTAIFNETFSINNNETFLMEDSPYYTLFTLWGYKMFVWLAAMMLILLVMMNSSRKVSLGALRL